MITITSINKKVIIITRLFTPLILTNGKITGFYDVYDFNAGNRESFLAEIATRIGSVLEQITDAKPFKIFY